MSSASDVGIVIGKTIATVTNYRQDFVENEDVTDINLVGIETEESTEYKIVRQCNITGCDELPFVIDHPVHGDIDSSTYYIDGDYCSKTIAEASASLITYIVDESTNYLVDENGIFIIAELSL